MPKQAPIEYKNMSFEPGRGYYVGYLKGKRKKYVEQKERFNTPEQALQALNLPQWPTKLSPSKKKTK